jgi:hypothetical protein
VRMSLTIPWVNLPEVWSAFSTMETDDPGLISVLRVPFIIMPAFQDNHITSRAQSRMSEPWIAPQLAEGAFTAIILQQPGRILDYGQGIVLQ